MSTYEPVSISPPDVEMVVADYLRSVCTRPGTMISRRLPDKLPVIASGTTYTAAIVVRDDGGPWPHRTLSLIVQGARDASYADTRQLAVWAFAQLAGLVERGGPVASVGDPRGPMSVADNPPEFHTTSDLIVVG